MASRSTAPEKRPGFFAQLRSLFTFTKAEFSWLGWALIGIVVLGVATKGMISRLAILGGVAAGYVTAAIRGELSFTKVGEADWLGLPDLTAPTFDISVLGLFVPVVLVLVADGAPGPQRAEQTAHLGDGVTGGVLDGGQGPLRRGGVTVEDPAGRCRLHADARDVVCDDVVQLAGDAQTLLDDRALAQLLGLLADRHGLLL